jgi:ABC-type multidrug transport system fused ATPase/permease subunit
MMLFRVVECETGSVSVDEVDISTLPLSFLRSRLAIIPQDPILFTGTVRFNLDPSGVYPDHQVWAAIRRVRLDAAVVELGGGLDSLVAEGGRNFSVGQRQLFCLARALLRDAHILLLDEATASVDVETDRVLQEMLRTAFAGRTVLTIAHRIESILDYDRILVLDAGKVVEFAPPKELLSQPESIFYSLAKASGVVGGGVRG